MTSRSKTISRRRRPTQFDMNMCFYGEIRREFVDDYLKMDGEFLVRSTVSNAMIISVFWKGRVRHFTPYKHKKGPHVYFSFGDKLRPSVETLIKYHLTQGVPLNDVYKTMLLRPVPCPKTKYPEADVEVHELLGEGNYGAVHKVRIISEDTVAAMKTLKESVDAKAKEEFVQEVNMMRTMGHPNVVKLIGTVEDEQGGGDIRILLEFLNKGTVANLVKTFRMTANGKCNICRQVASGMDYLHDMDIIHRDLAARNVLVHRYDDGNIVAKVSDFGLSRSDTSGKGYCLQHPQKLPYRWMAPESFQERKWTKASDVWSFGIFMWEVYSNGQLPYGDMPVSTLSNHIGLGNHPPRPSTCSDEIWQVMLSCWMLDPKKRPSMKDLKDQLGKLYGKMTIRQ